MNSTEEPARRTSSPAPDRRGAAAHVPPPAATAESAMAPIRSRGFGKASTRRDATAHDSNASADTAAKPMPAPRSPNAATNQIVAATPIAAGRTADAS